jgi:hypothetical protein
MPNEENLLKLYNALGDEYDLGSYDDFKVKMQDSNNRSKLWSAANADYDLGDFNAFEQRIGYAGGLGKPTPGSEAGPSGGRRLPSRLTGQQVKTYLGKYGASFTDSEYDQIAQQVAGKSLDEAMRIAKGIVTPQPKVAPMAPLEAGRQMLETAAAQRTGLAEQVQAQTDEMISQRGYLSPEQLQGEAMGQGAMPSATIPTMEQQRVEFATGFRKEGEAEAADVVAKMQPISKKSLLAKYAEEAREKESDEIDLGPFGSVKMGETPEEVERNLDQLITLGDPGSAEADFGFSSKQIYDQLKSNLGYENDKKLEEDLLKYFKTNQGLNYVIDDSKQKLSLYNQQYEQALQDPQSSEEDLVNLKRNIDKELKIQEMGLIVENLQYDRLPGSEVAALALANAGYTALYLGEGIRLSVNELTATILENTIEPLLPESWQGDIRRNLVDPVLYSRKRILEEKGELPFQSISSQSVIDGLNLLNVTSTATQIAGSIGATAAGGAIGFLIGGPAGAAYGATIAGGSLIYGEAADEARKSGASDLEAQAYALTNAAISGWLEKLGLKGLTKTIVTDAEKRYVLSAIRSELKKGVSIEKVASSLVNRFSNAAGSLIKAGTPESATETLQTTQELLLKKGFNEFILDEGDKKFEEPTIDEAGKLLAESLVTGFFGASTIPAGISLLARGNTKYEAAASAVVSGKKKVSDIVEITKGLILSGKVSAADGRAFIENLKIAEASKAALPKYVKDKQQRTRAISLMMERNKLTEEMKSSDPDLQDGYNKRLTEIKQELKSIADKNWVAPTNPFVASTAPGFSAAMNALSQESDTDKAARTFNKTVGVNNGLLTKLMKAMESNTEIATNLAKTVASDLEMFVNKLSSMDNKTPAMQEAIKTATDIMQKLNDYGNKRTDVSTATVGSLNMDDIIGRIAAGVDPADMDFMENVPEETLLQVADALSGIQDGMDVSEKDAASAADFLYDRYKQLSDLKAKVQQRIDSETNQTKKDRLTRSLSAINEAQSKISEDISTAVKYQQEKALRDEAAGTRTQPAVSPLSGPKAEAAPAAQPQQAQEYDPANEQEVVDDFNSKNEDQLLPGVVRAINSVAKLLAKIAPEVKFYVHTTTQDFVSALEADGVGKTDAKNSSGNTGQYISLNGKAMSVHINLEAVNREAIEMGAASRAIYHEAAHVILNKYFGSSPEVIKGMLDAVTKVIPKGISKQLDEFVANYDRNINEERIVELVEILAATEQRLDDTTISKIIKAINDFIERAANALGVQNVDRFLITDSRADFVDFVNSMARSTASGIQEISPETTKRIQKRYAVQEQAAGQVPVQPGARGGETMAEGEPEAGSEVATKASKAKAQEKKNYISGSELFKINAAPYYRTKVNKFSEALSLHKSRAYIRFKEDFSKIAEDLNLEIVSAIDSIGGWAGTSEVSTVFFVKGTWEDAVTAAALMGITAPEVQDSTIAAQIVEDGSDLHKADRFEIKVNNPELAFKALREVSFEQDGYTIVDDTIWLLDFSMGSDPEFFAKFDQLEKTIKSYGAEIISTDRKPVRSQLIDDKGEYGPKREDIISEFERSSVQQGRKRGYISDNLEAIKERLNAFKRWIGIDYSPEKARLEELRRKEIELASQFKSLSKKESEELSRLTAKLADVYASVIASDKARYEEAKTEIEQVAEEVRVLVNKSFVSEFPIKRAQRGGEKVARWYFGDVTALGDGARTNVIVNTDSDADFLYEAILKNYPDDSVRSEIGSTVLGYPKRLVEIRTSNGKRAEIQVMTPEGYLAKDGLKYFAEDLKPDAKRYLDNVRKNLGWNIPDGIGHYFYEIHRDPNVSAKIRKMAEPLSTAYYNAMLNSDTSTLTDQEFRDSVAEFKNLVDNADKSRWDKSNSGKSPAELDQYLGEQDAEAGKPGIETKASKSQIVDKVQSQVSPGKTVGTRNPTAKGATEKGSDPNSLITLDAMRRDERTYKNNASLVASYPIVARDIPKPLLNEIKKAQRPLDAIEIKISEKRQEIEQAKKEAADLIKSKSLKINKKISINEAKKQLTKILNETSPSAGMASVKNKIKAKQDKLDSLTEEKKLLEKAYSKKIEDIAKSMPIKVADKIFDALVKATKDNLEALINLFPKDIRDIAKLWYDGANIIAQDFAGKYKITKEQSAAVLAVFSPQKDWFMNISLAERAMNVWKNMQDYTIDANMERQMIIRAGYPQIEKINDDGTVVYTGGAKPLLDQDGEVVLDDEGNPIFKNWDEKKAKENKELAMIMINEMRGVPLKNLPIGLQARFIRMHSEVYDSPSFNIYRPDGVIGGPSKTEKGNNRNIAWGGYNTIEKAIKVMSADKANMMEVISTELGDQHKVRSFYNNIIDPSNKNGHVTMDTHAIAAVLWKALSGNSTEVTQNFGGAGTSSNSTIGSKGLYAAFAKAYSEAANDLGYLPREIQSITWEAVRMLFTAKWKSQKVNLAKIDALWNEYATNLDITMAQVRDEIFKLATKSKYNGTKSIEQAINDDTGVGRPDWAEVFDSGLSTQEGEKTYDKIQLSPGGGLQYGRGRGDGGPRANDPVTELVPGSTKGRESRDLGVTTRPGIETKASKARAKIEPKYDPDNINQGKPQLDLQTRIYDAAAKAWEVAKTKAKYEQGPMISSAVLDETGLDLGDIELATLIKDLILGKRPEYKRSDTGKYERIGTRKDRSAVLTRVIAALEQMMTDRRVNKSIMSSLLKAVKGDTTYTVENQTEVEMIVDAIFNSVNGIADVETGNALLALAMNAKGGIRAFMFGRIANEAWDKARETKDLELRQAYRDIGNAALNTLSTEATDAGRFNSIIYRLQQTNPEFIVEFEANKVRNQTEQGISDANKKKDKVNEMAKDLNNAQTQAAQQAAQAPSVQAAVNAATGGPSTQPQTPPAQKSKSQQQAQQQTNTSSPKPSSQVDNRIKELKNLLKNKFGGIQTKAARTAPAGVDPDILDIITELAENYIKKGITDPTALIAKVNADVVAAGGSLSSAYYNQMWSNVSTAATAMQNDMNASSLAGRIVGRVKQRVRPTPKSFDPIAELIDELLNKATEDLAPLPKKTPESRLDKLTRLISQYYDAKDMWEASKAKVEQRIDDIDPMRFTAAEKQAMKDMLDKFFANDLSYFEIKQTPTPGAAATVDSMIREQMKQKKLEIEKILLEANTKQAQTKDEFIDQIVADIVSATGITSARATAIARSFAEQYDKIVTKKQEEVLKRRLPLSKTFEKFKRKSNAQRAFEAIKYGMIDPSIQIYDKAGNIIETTKLFCEMFDIPYLDNETRDALTMFAEAIAETPPGILRQQVLNDMAMFMKMHQYRTQGSIGDRFLAQTYANLLTSTDTMVKAFNSNIIMYNFEFATQAVRSAAKGDFRMIPLLTRAYYGKKGVGKIWTEKATSAMTDPDGFTINPGEDYYKLKDGSFISLANPKVAALSGHYEGLLRYSMGINQARAVLNNIVMAENFTNNVTGEVYRKYAKTKVGRTWGEYVTLAQRGLGALDALTTAAATNARFGDLLFDAIKFYAKKEGQKVSGREISDIVNNIQGTKPLIQLDALNTAILEMEQKFGAPVNLKDKAKKALLLSRAEEIVKDKMKDRIQQAVTTYPWLSELDQGQVADMMDMSYEVATKIGMMGTPPGTGGVLSSMLGFMGRYVRFSNIQYGTFTNAPVNAAMFILQGNSPIGALITGVRLIKSQRGFALGGETAENLYKQSGIRTKMYGKSVIDKPIFGQYFSFTWNLEKQDMLTRFALIQGPVIAATYMAGNAVVAALASSFGDDEEEKERLVNDGIKAIGKIDQKERILRFFGDKLSSDPKKREGVWKSIPVYATGAMYGYSGGGYGKMQSMKAMYGIEPYTVYAYGKRILSYRDNPVLGAMFMQMAASTDAMLFTENAELGGTQHGLIMASVYSQLNLVRDQSNLRSISELFEFAAGQRAYEGIDGFEERAKMYLSKTAGNIINNAIMPAELKNLNQDVNAVLGNYMDDPKEFLDFVVYRWPIISSAVIEGDKTGPFGYPLKTQPKRVFPIGLEQFKMPLMLNGSLNIPTVDELLSTEDATYTNLFIRNDNDTFLNPKISGYYKVDDYGDYVRESFTLEQRKQIREEYKILMRQFAEQNIDVNTPFDFKTNLSLFLSFYEDVGYQRYIINKVLGPDAKSIVIDGGDALINMGVDEMLFQKIESGMKQFEPRE